MSYSEEIEKVRLEMQDGFHNGYPDHDNRPPEDDAVSDDAMFWVIVIVCIVLFMGGGYFAGSMSCAA